jgi:hypothetical protein
MNTSKTSSLSRVAVLPIIQKVVVVAVQVTNNEKHIMIF